MKKRELKMAIADLRGDVIHLRQLLQRKEEELAAAEEAAESISTQLLETTQELERARRNEDMAVADLYNCRNQMEIHITSLKIMHKTFESIAERRKAGEKTDNIAEGHMADYIQLFLAHILGYIDPTTTTTVPNTPSATL